MSATLDSGVFAQYFEKVGLSVGIGEIEGRTFPVERLYLSDAIEHCGYDVRSAIKTIYDLIIFLGSIACDSSAAEATSPVRR
jgi:HrpA-like RNA helicase